LDSAIEIKIVGAQAPPNLSRMRGNFREEFGLPTTNWDSTYGALGVV